jgi:two-component system, OmpR family, phosphate regulon sensor histidine kinase PhoR
MQQVEHRLMEDVNTVSELLAESREGNIPQETLDAVMRGKVSHVVVVDTTGTTLWSRADSDLKQELPNLFGPADASRVYERTDQSVGPDGRQWLTVRRALPDKALIKGDVLAAFPITHLQREFSAATVRIWLIVATAAVLSLAITYVFVGRIIEPLETLTRAAQDIASGDFPAEVRVRSRNEIGTLAQAFNSMSLQLTNRIHDLQEQRQRSAESHHRLEAVLSAMVEGVMAIDANQQILLANQAAVQLLDLRAQNIVGRPLWEAVRQVELHELVNNVLAGNPCEQIEVEIARTQSLLAVTATPFNGEPCTGAVLVMHDVTELRRLENLRREFVQNVSHELKTPLSSIAAYADTLLEGGLEDADSNRHFVQRIAEQSDRLHTLILDLIALARMDATDQNFEVIPTDVTRIVQASIDGHQAVASTKQIELRGEGPTGPLMGMADDDGLRTIIDNLLDNALNYTPQNGRVVVRWRQDKQMIVLEVQDTGVGIAKEHQARIFERFFRIDRARSREMGGTGLGLAIVKHLCQMFGGSVKVSSQLGQGSTFIVQLPVAEELALTT